MLEQETDEFNIRLLKVESEQFAIVEDVFDENSDDIAFATTLRISNNNETRKIGVGCKIEFRQKDTIFLICENTCHLEVEEKSWTKLYDDKEDKLTIVRPFAIKLASLAIGLVRGYMLAKLEKHESLSSIFIPMLDLKNLVPNDIVLSSKDEKEQ